jgi:hypothetical protein
VPASARGLRIERETFAALGDFVDELKRQEYPASVAGKCPVPHTVPAESLTVDARWPANAEAPVFSPVPRPIPEGDGERAYVLLQVLQRLPIAALRTRRIGQLAPEADGYPC